MEKDSIKIKLISAFVAIVIIHGVIEKIIFLDQSDDSGDFSGNYVMKNSDSSSTAVAFNVIPSIIDID